MSEDNKYPFTTKPLPKRTPREFTRFVPTVFYGMFDIEVVRRDCKWFVDRHTGLQVTFPLFWGLHFLFWVIYLRTDVDTEEIRRFGGHSGRPGSSSLPFVVHNSWVTHVDEACLRS